MESRSIRIRNARTNNLRGVDVDIPIGGLTVICGVSGAGKSSLAFDTLYAEGHRRYAATLSLSLRRRLQQLPRPAVDRIDGLLPAVAVRQYRGQTESERITIGSRSRLLASLKNLLTEYGTRYCLRCGLPVRSWSPAVLARELTVVDHGRLAMIAWSLPDERRRGEQASDATAAELYQDGFVRVIAGQSVYRTDDAALAAISPDQWLIIGDRVRLESARSNRLTESLEAAFREGNGRIRLFVEGAQPFPVPSADGVQSVTLDGSPWQEWAISQSGDCSGCTQPALIPLPESLDWNTAAGACSGCQGSGVALQLPLDACVSDPARSLRDGGLLLWKGKLRSRARREFNEQAAEAGIDIDAPLSALTAAQRHTLQHGARHGKFAGLDGVCSENSALPARDRPGWWEACVRRGRCQVCDGSRLRNGGRGYQLQGRTLAELCRLELSALQGWLEQLPESISSHAVTVRSRTITRALVEAGLGYLSADRSAAQLSSGEMRRVELTADLHSGLVHTLYVIDEPSAGLDTEDSRRMLQVINRLRERGNTVVVVEHHPEFTAAADYIIELGPEAGHSGGHLVFSGPEISWPGRNKIVGDDVTWSAQEANTAEDHDAGRRPVPGDAASLRITGGCCHNIEGMDVRIPLGTMTVIRGVSGAGKTSLMHGILEPLAAKGLQQSVDRFEENGLGTISGLTAISDVLALDQSPLPASARSVPVTLIGAFDEIRKLLASSYDARKRNMTAGTFSFNSARGGRCPVCRGLGEVTIDMQFLPDIRTQCEECRGRRFVSDVLEVRYRGRGVDEILDMTADEAFTFFHAQPRIQSRMNALREAGLGYLQLGRGLSTLSGGECQRLRMALMLAGVSRTEWLMRPYDQADGVAESTRSGRLGRLFLLDEPTTGLHRRDVDRLLHCLRRLVSVGDTVVVADRSAVLSDHADYVITIGPGPGRYGGRLVAEGSVN